MNTAATPEVTPQRIMQFSWSFTFPLAIGAAVENGVFDALASGPRDLVELEKTTGCSAQNSLSLATAPPADPCGTTN